MTSNSKLSKVEITKRQDVDLLENRTGTNDYSRRDALRAMGKFSAFFGATGVVVLSAEDVVANSGNVSCKNQCKTMYPPPRSQPGFKNCMKGCKKWDEIEQLFDE